VRALYFDGGLKQIELPVPERKKDEALIKVIYAGICQTDIEIFKGYMDFTGIPGHEFVGVIVEAHDEKLKGKRVVGEINIGCGKCSLCLNGDPRHCKDRSVLGIAKKNGTFAEYITLPTENILEVPESVSDREAVFTEPLAAALQIPNQVKISPDDSIAITGDGKLGLLISQVLKLYGTQIILYGIDERKMSIAKNLGIKAVRYSEDEENRYDIVVECSGSEQGLYDALNLVKPAGHILLKSTYNKNPHVDISKIVVNEIRLTGSRCGRFEPALRILENGMVNVNVLVDKIFNLEEGLSAFEFIENEKPLKVLFRVS